jgi:hypothetical protein
MLIIAFRDHRRILSGRRVNIDVNLHAVLRSIAVEALARVAASEAVEYTPYVEASEGEYLEIDPSRVSRLPRSAPRGGRRSENDAATVDDAASIEDQETIALLGLVSGADYLEPIGAGQILETLPETFYAQIVCFADEDNRRVGFVTKTNPRSVIKRSWIPLGRGDNADRFKRVSPPDLILESNVHAIVSTERVAVLNRAQFQFLLSDTDLVFRHVPAQVEKIKRALTGLGVPLAPGMGDVIVSAGQASVQLAKRLDSFGDRVSQIDVDRIRTGSGFRESDLDKADFVNAAGQIACEPARVRELVDALEGRFFRDSFSPERRRADRFRRRA